MNTIELTNEEQAILAQILQHELTTLETEIGHTDHLEFKEILKARRQVLNGLRQKVQAAAATV